MQLKNVSELSPVQAGETSKVPDGVGSCWLERAITGALIAGILLMSSWLFRG
jgi:hypothetical protein